MNKILKIVANLPICLLVCFISLALSLAFSSVSLAEPTNSTQYLGNSTNILASPDSSSLSSNTLSQQPILANNPQQDIVGTLAQSLELKQAITVLYTVFALILLILLLNCIYERSLIKLAHAFLVALLAGYSYLVINYGYLPNLKAQMLTTNTALAVLVALSLFTFTHIARQTIRAKLHSSFLDILFLIIAFIGVAVAILPVFPQFHYLFGYLEFWPLVLTLTFLPCLIIWISTTRVVGLYILVNLVPILACLAALIGKNSGFDSELWSLELLFSFALASFILIFIQDKKQTHKNSHAKNSENTVQANSLKIADIKQNSPKIAQSMPDLFKLENALRKPLDELMKEACSLDISIDNHLAKLNPVEHKEALACREFADKMIASSRDLARIVTELPKFIEAKEDYESKENFFNLQKLLSSVYNDFLAQAESRKLAFSWYISPTITNFYRGDSAGLKYILSKLTESAIRANRQGAVRIAVSRYADDKSFLDEHDLGILEFSISDSGSVQPVNPEERSSLSIAKAWEFASRHQGGVHIESKENELDIKMHIRMQALDKYGSSVQVESLRAVNKLEISNYDPQNVLLVSSNSSLRRLLCAKLINMDKKVREASNANNAANLYKKYNFATVLIDADMPNEESIATIAEIRHFEGEHSLTNVALIAIAKNHENGKELIQAGCTNYFLTHTNFDLNKLQNKFIEIEKKEKILSSKPLLEEMSIIPLSADEEIPELYHFESENSDIIESIEPELVIVENDDSEYLEQDKAQSEDLEIMTVDPLNSDTENDLPQALELQVVVESLEDYVELEIREEQAQLTENQEENVIFEEEFEKFEIIEISNIAELDRNPEILGLSEALELTEVLEVPEIQITEEISEPQEQDVYNFQIIEEKLEDNTLSVEAKKAKHEVKIIPNAKTKNLSKQGGLLARFFSTKEAIHKDDLQKVDLESSEFVSAPKPMSKEQKSFTQIKLDLTDPELFENLATDTIDATDSQVQSFAPVSKIEAPIIAHKLASLDFEPESVSDPMPVIKDKGNPSLDLISEVAKPKTIPMSNAHSMSKSELIPEAKIEIKAEPVKNVQQSLLLDLLPSKKTADEPSKSEIVVPNLLLDFEVSVRKSKKKKKRKKDIPALFDEHEELIDLTDAQILSDDYIISITQGLNLIDKEWQAYQKYIKQSQLKLAESSVHKMLNEAKNMQLRSLREVLESLLAAIDDGDFEAIKQLSEDFAVTFMQSQKEYRG